MERAIGIKVLSHDLAGRVDPDGSSTGGSSGSTANAVVILYRPSWAGSLQLHDSVKCRVGRMC
jgi:hypothetical protein